MNLREQFRAGAMLIEAALEEVFRDGRTIGAIECEPFSVITDKLMVEFEEWLDEGHICHIGSAQMPLQGEDEGKYLPVRVIGNFCRKFYRLEVYIDDAPMADSLAELFDVLFRIFVEGHPLPSGLIVRPDHMYHIEQARSMIDGVIRDVEKRHWAFYIDWVKN